MVTMCHLETVYNNAYILKEESSVKFFKGEDIII